MSRAIGDRSMQRFVTATPEVITHTICNDDHFFILDSDGNWCVIFSGETAYIVKNAGRVLRVFEKPLLGGAMDKGSDDNSTVIVVLPR